MDYPTIFPLYESLERLSPEDVRTRVTIHGFKRSEGSGTSEIWYKLAGRGYAIVRIDAAGHARKNPGAPIGGVSAGVHGGVPHYHKEWIQADLFQTYLTAYVRQVVRYNDQGQPITRAMNDGVAKETHIKR